MRPYHISELDVTKEKDFWIVEFRNLIPWKNKTKIAKTMDEARRNV